MWWCVSINYNLDLVVEWGECHVKQSMIYLYGPITGSRQYGTVSRNICDVYDVMRLSADTTLPPNNVSWDQVFVMLWLLEVMIAVLCSNRKNQSLKWTQGSKVESQRLLVWTVLYSNHYYSYHDACRSRYPHVETMLSGMLRRRFFEAITSVPGRVSRLALEIAPAVSRPAEHRELAGGGGGS